MVRSWPPRCKRSSRPQRSSIGLTVWGCPSLRLFKFLLLGTALLGYGWVRTSAELRQALDRPDPSGLQHRAIAQNIATDHLAAQLQHVALSIGGGHAAAAGKRCVRPCL
jgi:hypothetical protein